MWFKSSKRMLILTTNLFVLIVVFSFPPMSLPAEQQYRADPRTHERLVVGAHDAFVRAELQKGIAEIQMRLQDQSTWFQYKFLFVGGLLAGLISLFQYTRSVPSGERGQRAGSSLSRGPNFPVVDLPFFALGLATISGLSFMIDFHIRENAIVINQIGLWIAFHVEPLYLNTNQFPSYSFLPWETFLRSGASGMHTDVLNSITFFWPIHSLTIVCFLLYLWSLMQIPNRVGADAMRRSEIDVTAFFLVHVLLIVLSWTGHYVPPMFEVKLPVLGARHGTDAALPYATFAILLTVFNWWFVLRPMRRFRLRT